MFADIVDLRDFYRSPLGLMAQRVLSAQAGALWGTVRREKIVGLGYGVPLLTPWRGEADSVYAFMPAKQGAAFWPSEGLNLSCLVLPHQLPLPDNSVDRVVALHALEGMSDPEPLLREVWRVMKSGGRFLVIVPNRRGLWAHSDSTPFGCGQPYSAAQIKKVLQEHGFCVEQSCGALYAPPSAAKINLSLAEKTEAYASRFFSGLGGVWMLDVRKQQGATVKAAKWAPPRLILPLSFPAAPALPG